MSRKRLSLFAAAALLAASGAVLGQGAPAWPTKSVTIIVPLQPGAATDIEARLYAQKMTENIGRTVIVDYKPGAGSTIGKHYVVKSAPDGHNIIMLAPTFTFSNLSYPNLTLTTRPCSDPDCRAPD